MMKIYLIKYVTNKRGELLDSEIATSQITAYNQFKTRKPNAFGIRIKSQTGAWINHYLPESAV